VAIVKDSKRKDAARDFMSYLQSRPAKDIFRKYGFVVLDLSLGIAHLVIFTFETWRITLFSLGVGLASPTSRIQEGQRG
jgi:hypothetical protein